jgi:hypothetical protein
VDTTGAWCLISAYGLVVRSWKPLLNGKKRYIISAIQLFPHWKYILAGWNPYQPCCSHSDGSRIEPKVISMLSVLFSFFLFWYVWIVLHKAGSSCRYIPVSFLYYRGANCTRCFIMNGAFIVGSTAAATNDNDYHCKILLLGMLHHQNPFLAVAIYYQFHRWP